MKKNELNAPQPSPQSEQKSLPLIAVLDEQGFCRLLGSSTGEKYDLVVDKVKTMDKNVARSIFRQRGHDIPEPAVVASTQETLTDDEVEELWANLTDVPFDEDEDTSEMLLGEDWHIFKKGAERESIWKWFDAQHSKGVVYLLVLSDFNSSEESSIDLANAQKAMKNGDIVYRDTFAPTGSDHMQYEGMRFTVLRELEPGKEYDRTEENPRMYEIHLENNVKVIAFSDEVEV